jgi:hypothetical protein
MAQTIDVPNSQLVNVTVGLGGDRIGVLIPNPLMTKREALIHAAWLVALADDGSEPIAFDDILEAVRNT